MGRPARPLHEPGNHHSSERCSPCHSADCGSLIEQPTLLRIAAPTPRPGARSTAVRTDRAIGPAQRLEMLAGLIFVVENGIGEIDGHWDTFLAPFSTADWLGTSSA